jgi:hypothetical protein
MDDGQIEDIIRQRDWLANVNADLESERATQLAQVDRLSAECIKLRAALSWITEQAIVIVSNLEGLPDSTQVSICLTLGEVRAIVGQTSDARHE